MGNGFSRRGGGGGGAHNDNAAPQPRRRRRPNRQPATNAQPPPSSTSSSGVTTLPHPQNWMTLLRQDPDDLIDVTDFGLDLSSLTSSLRLMASYIHQRGESCTIIAIGGPINTVLLKDRRKRTHLDWMGIPGRFSTKQAAILGDAADVARALAPGSLNDTWFHPSTQLHFRSPLTRQAIVRKALAADEAVFQQPGLKILAAPWDYACVAALNRLAGIGITSTTTVTTVAMARVYDLEDAIAYLQRTLQQEHNGRPVTATDVCWWAQTYGLPAHVATIKEVGRCFLNRYGYVGILREERRMLGGLEEGGQGRRGGGG